MYTVSIMGVDPGGVSGWARLNITTGGNERTVWSEGQPYWDSGELNFSEHHLALDQTLSSTLRPMRHPHSLILLCEGFDNRANPAANLISLQYIGVCKRWAQQRPNVTALYPSPSEKEWASDKKLKGLGLYEPGHKDINDAKRHIVTYVCNKRMYYPMLEQLRKALDG